MADQDCCISFGGRIAITVDGKRFAPTDADITIEPTNLTVDGVANQDGSAAYMAKPKLYRLKATLRQPCGIVWNETIRKCRINAECEEVDNDRTHLFTGGRMVGTPELNLSNGQVTGIEIVSSQYQAI